jgi:hypothetical protein
MNGSPQACTPAHLAGSIMAAIPVPSPTAADLALALVFIVPEASTAVEDFMAVAGFMVVAEVMVVAGVIDETRAGESAVSVKGVAYDACNTDWV